LSDSHATTAKGWTRSSAGVALDFAHCELAHGVLLRHCGTVRLYISVARRCRVVRAVFQGGWRAGVCDRHRRGASRIDACLGRQPADSRQRGDYPTNAARVLQAVGCFLSGGSMRHYRILLAGVSCATFGAVCAFIVKGQPLGGLVTPRAAWHVVVSICVAGVRPLRRPRSSSHTATRSGSLFACPR
jgi:hypothetical protein